MEIRGIRVPIDGPPELVTLENDLDSFQAEVGGSIQAIDLKINGEPVTGVLNEEGKLHGLAVNLLASRLAHDFLMEGDFIVGPFLILGPTDDEGYWTSVADELLAPVLAGWETIR